MRMLTPPHPGAFVKTEVIEPHGLTVAAAAKVLGVSRPALSTFLNGRSALSGMMALRIEKAFGVKMDTLMRMQSSYDIARTRSREGELDVEPYPPAADETDYLLRSPANAERLREAMARAGSGERAPMDVGQLRRQLGLAEE